MNKYLLGNGIDEVAILYFLHILGYFWDIIRDPDLFNREVIQVFPKVNLNLSMVLKLSGKSLKQLGVIIRGL